MEETFLVLRHCDFLAPSSMALWCHFVLAWVLIALRVTSLSLPVLLPGCEGQGHYVLGIPAVNLDPAQGVLLGCALCLWHPVHTPGWEATQELGPKVLKLDVFG